MAVNPNEWQGLELSGGRYRITSRLGEGGMGFVYRADDRHLHAPVVIKVPRRAMLDDPQFVERFQREIRSLVTLSHPHIVNIIDVGQHEGVPFAVMRYMDGGDLEARRPRNAEGHPLAVSPTALRDWLPEVAGALDFVHRKGYVHRDMKPVNVLFDRERHAYLSDFGVAKVVRDAGSGGAGNMTATGIVLGTPEYMAPELVMGREVTGRVDQYALAVTVYELLAARRPFEAESSSALLVAQATNPAPALHTLRPSVPKALSSVVARALSKDPAARYATCREFTDAVLATIASAGGGASSKSTAERIYLSCPTCERRLRVTSQNAGSLVGCPGCQARLRVAADLSRLTVSQSAPADRPVTRVEQHAVRPGLQTMVETPDDSPAAARRSRTLLEPSRVETATGQEKIDTPTAARSPSITIPLPKYREIPPWAWASAGAAMVLLLLLLGWAFRSGEEIVPLATEPAPGEMRDTAESDNLASGQSGHTEGQERPRQEPSGSEGKPKSTDEPIENAQRSESQTPLDAEGYYNRGRSYYDQGKLDEAIADCTKAIRIDPNVADTYYSRGICYLAQGKSDLAIADYTEAIRLKPDYTDAYVNRGVAYGAQGKSDLAIADYTTAIRLKPDDADAYYNRGIAYGAQGKSDLAIADYTTAIRLKPDFADAYVNQGISYGAQGKSDLEIADYTEAIRLKPDHTNAYYNRGIAYRFKGDNDKAIADYTEAIRLKPDHTNAYYNRGIAYRFKGDNDEAIADYTEAIRLNPDYTQAYYNRGIAYDDQGKHDLAIADYTFAILLKPDHTNAYINRGVTYRDLGNRAQAERDFAKAKELGYNP